MLYLSRKLGESIIINNSIELTVIEVRGKTVKLGFNFPSDATVLRKEIYDKIMAENLAAAQSGVGVEADFLTGEFDLSHLDSPKKP
ncbi:MAG: carbon storage regulator CsrA [Alphaproteobacteria bacterium]|jgi:carbon storage regulator|nr:carbon storage regulator CsrA [Rickettsiales bacterium]